MADRILHKRSLTPGSVPTTSSLEIGELAINVNDGKLFLRQSGSVDQIVNIGESASFAATASYVQTAQTASYVVTAQTASYVLNAVSSSFATTASFAASASWAPVSNPFPFTGSALITGSLGVTGSLTATQIGAGAVPSGSVRLDVRASSSAATDTVFRVRNSADTFNLMSVQGDGQVVFLTNTTNTITIGGTGTRPTLFGTNLQVGVSTSGNRLSFATNEGFIGDFSHSGTHTFRNTFNDDRGVSIIAGDQNQTPYFYFRNGRNIYLSTNPNTAIKGWSKTFWIENGSAPTESLADHFALYSADRGGVAGKASPHLLF